MLSRGPLVLRLAVAMAAALGVAAATVPVAAQESRSLQDMLVAAVDLGDAAAVRSLLAAGADVAQRGVDGKTAVDVAVETGHFEIAELLIQERRRQRDAAIAQSAASVITPATASVTPEVESEQHSAEAAPPAPPSPSPVSATSPVSVAGVPAGATVEQLLAVARQLTQAAQALAAAQRAAAARDTQTQVQAEVQTQPLAPVPPSQLIDPDFLPKPGRKPEIKQARLVEPYVAASRASGIVVVTPRRQRSAEEGAELARRNLEYGEELPVIPSVVAPVGPDRVPANVVRVMPSSKNSIAPVHAPIQAGMPPVMALPVAPVQEQPMTAVTAPASQTAHLTPRRSNGPNPFDPNSMPQGSILPLADPVTGNASVIARAKALPDPAEQEVAMAAEQVSLPETPRLSAMPQSPRAHKPTRAVASAAMPADKSEDAILQNVANAVGIGSRDEELPRDGANDADGAERLSPSRMPVIKLRQPLTNVALRLGNSVATNQRPLPREASEPDPCIKRSGGSLMFCVVPVDWHPRVDPAFELTTYLYQGSRAIARYDGGKATHYHTLFKSIAYDDVVKYFTAKYGPPTDEWKRTIAPFDLPRQPNPTMVWRSRDTRTNVVTILEVRRYDDARNVFPDMEHGAVRLYTAGAQRVFPVITAMDLMGIDWAARSDHVDSPVDSSFANTIRVRR